MREEMPVLLADLPGALEAGLALEDRKQRGNRVLPIIAEAMAALGFAKDPAGVKRAVIRADQLEPSQRAGLAQLASYPGLPIFPYPVPSVGWAIRQWLGLDPPGPLFAQDAKGGTLYDTLRAALQRSEHEALGRLVSLPMPQRLEVLADLQLVPHDYGATHVSYLLGNPHVVPPNPEPVGRVLEEIGPGSGEWARRLADRMIALDDAPPLFHREKPAGNRMGLFETRTLCLPVFLAMARGGGAIEPRFDRILWFERWTDPAIVHDCIGAIPEDRREQAILDVLAASLDTAFFAGEILPRYPGARVASSILVLAPGSADPRAVLRAVKAAAKQNPAIAAELAKHEMSIPRLRVADRKAPPRPAELDGIAVQQLEAAAVGNDGTPWTAAQILAGEAGQEFAPENVEMLRIENARGEHAYDAWLIVPDSGTIFRAGTTEVVAERVQGALECADPALRAALQDALRPKKKRAPARKKKPTPKSGASTRKRPR